MSFVKQVIYSPEEVEKTFSNLYGEWMKLNEDERKKNPRWWAKALEINWDAKPFPGKKESRFWNAITTINGKRGRPHMRFVDETNGNSILTTDEKEFNELKKKYPNSYKFTKEPRGKDMPPDIQFRKWTCKIEKDDKDNTQFKLGPDGKPILPDDKFKSKIYPALYYYFKAVSDEIQYQKQIGRIVDDESSKNGLPNAIHNNNISIKTPLSTHYKKGEHRNKELLNPFARAKLVFNKDDPNKGTDFKDKRKKFTKDGKQDFEKAKLEDGSPITNENVHHWLGLGCNISGLLDISGICMHNMGISGQMKVKMLISQPREKSSMTAADVFDGEDDPDIGNDSDHEKESNNDSSKGSDKPDNKKSGTSEEASNMYKKNMVLMKEGNKNT